MIEAAGGVVWRIAATGTLELLIVHRPRYDDWSLPKGKARRDEGALACALREVQEETGLSCNTAFELPEVHYQDRKGRDKRVRYWAMTVDGGSFAPNDEVDRVLWITPAEAQLWLTYPREMPVIEAFESTLGVVSRLSA